MKKDNNYYMSLDKRTSEYKEWKKFNKISNESIGVGDTLEKIFKATGVKKVVDALFDDCHCTERKEKLNKLFPYKRTAQRCLTEQQYNEYKEYQERRLPNVWEEKDIELLIRLNAHVFAIQYDARNLCRNCNGSANLLRDITNELDKVYNSYEE